MKSSCDTSTGNHGLESKRRKTILKPIDAQNGHIDSSDDQIINITWNDEKGNIPYYSSHHDSYNNNNCNNES